MLLDYKWKDWNHSLLLMCSDHHNYMHQLVDQNLQRDFHYWKQLENKQEMKDSRFMKLNNCIN
jgi:hypothetical protein